MPIIPGPFPHKWRFRLPTNKDDPVRAGCQQSLRAARGGAVSLVGRSHAPGPLQECPGAAGWDGSRVTPRQTRCNATLKLSKNTLHQKAAHHSGLATAPKATPLSQKGRWGRRFWVGGIALAAVGQLPGGTRYGGYSSSMLARAGDLAVLGS
jgi:hypothetical protein